MLPPFFKYKILLASQSPRRQMLLSHSGFETELIKIDVEENFDTELKAHEIPMYLAQKKNLAYAPIVLENELLDMAEAKRMLQKISGKMHTVYTAVCVRSYQKSHLFYDESHVYFNIISDEMIDYYLAHYQPLDKAGAYGIQEFIGYVGIQKIEGCYYNVMGFPVSKFIQELAVFNG